MNSGRNLSERCAFTVEICYPGEKKKKSIHTKKNNRGHTCIHLGKKLEVKLSAN